MSQNVLRGFVDRLGIVSELRTGVVEHQVFVLGTEIPGGYETCESQQRAGVEK